jgi:hypothetical protein
MSLNDFQGLKRGDPNYKGHVLDLFIRIKIYVESRLHDKGRKIRSYTLFFRPDGILLTDGLIKETTEPIPTKETTQSTKQPILIRKREERSR